MSLSQIAVIVERRIRIWKSNRDAGSNPIVRTSIFRLVEEYFWEVQKPYLEDSNIQELKFSYKWGLANLPWSEHTDTDVTLVLKNQMLIHQDMFIRAVRVGF